MSKPKRERYALSLIVGDELKDLVTISTTLGRDGVALFIKKNTLKLYNPFIYPMIETILDTEELSDSEDIKAVNVNLRMFVNTLHYKEPNNHRMGLNIAYQIKHPKEFYLPHIQHFVEQLSTDDIFDMFTFYDDFDDDKDTVTISIKKYNMHSVITSE